MTSSEYDEAARTTISCLCSSFVGSSVRSDDDGIQLQFSLQLGSHSERQALAALASCRADHFDAVESVYLAQYARFDLGRGELEAQLHTCLAEQGVIGVERGMTDFQLFSALMDQDAPQAAWDCRDQFLLVTGELGPRPSD